MSYDEAKARYEAEHQAEPEPEVRTDYRCRATGCPNAGTMGNLCFFHAQESDATRWPELTHRIMDTWPAMANWMPRADDYDAPHSVDRHALKQALGEFVSGASVPPARQWAVRLRDREAAGEKLTLAQREMWRDALRNAPFGTEGTDDDEAYFAGR